MADPDENNPPDVTNNDDQLADKLSRLSADQQALYRNQVDNNYEINGRVSREYQLKLADSLLKNLNANELSHELKELNRQEYQYTYWRDQPGPGKQTKEAPPLVREPRRPEQTAALRVAAPRAETRNPLEGKIPNAPPRDYSQLQRTHDELGTAPKSAGRQTPAPKPHEQTTVPATAILSKESLALMIEHFPEIRREANLPTTQSEINERANLTRQQDADRVKLEQSHGAQPNQQQFAERDLLDHQHLAEQVGVQAKWIALHLGAQASPDAEQYSADSRRAFQTARQTHELRQKAGTEMDRSEDATPKIRDDGSQKQNDEQQALHGGKVLSSEQRANLSPDARHAVEHKERSDAARETSGSSRDQTAQKGNANPGKSPSGGRSGR